MKVITHNSIFRMNPILFVSLGPGEPELITVKGLKALQAADCIFCPETQTRDGRTLSRAAGIMQQLDIPNSSIRRFTLPMSKLREEALNVYDRVYAEIVLLYKENKNICIVAEGDAGFYSSVHYIFEKLQAGHIPVMHIAGIPAFIAAGALGGLHIASREERLTVIPGITTTEEIEKLVEEKSTVVIMKLSQCTDEVHRCIRLHPEYRYHYFENVGTPEEKYLNDNHRIETLRFPYFSLLIIRKDSF
ncbi:putative precorrin-2 C(20)-methyltransferase [Bacteroides fluxus YIT 12057]|uniref:Cobalt-precorrin-2 C(20)-methyltransferase n=2 Tax=Bacteroides fluxus TaxID=626930 RepID=F3PUC3_9BACE|nr:putative precorrin-2 C(20)-methyltransferase [Bacteroides fluxus YIT 12057]